MNFLNPLFLFGLAAAALPIVIHLFTRRRPREVSFPSLEFLAEVHQSEIRRLRLRQWLLLALRTLAVAAIAMAMARPVLRGHLGARGSAATTLVALVDVSGSMQAMGAGNHTLADGARRVVDDLLSTLGPGDEMLLVPYDRAPRPVTPQPSGDLPRLRAALRSLEVGAAATNHAAALLFAARAIGEAHALNRELFWISDFQASGLRDSAALRVPPGAWAGARIYLTALEPRTRANAAISDVALAPGEGGGALAVEGASFDATPGDLALSVRAAGDSAASGELGRGFLNLPASGRVSTLVPLDHLPEGGGVAGIPDDALALDNRRWFTSGHAAAVRVLIREDGAASPLRLALEAGGSASGLEVQTVDATTLVARARDCDVIVLGDLERLAPSELQAVLDFWRAGGALFVTLGARADAAFWSTSLLHELGVGALGAASTAPAGSAWRLHVAAAGHAVLAGFVARPGEPLSNARFNTVRSIDAGHARVLLDYDRAHPALLEAPHALVFSALLDPASTDFTVSGAFLPLIHQSVRALARGSASLSLAPGDRYQAPVTPGAWRIVNDAGRELPSEVVAAGGSARLTSAPIEQPGLYRVFQGAALHGVFAVNPDPRESDLTELPIQTVLAGFPTGRARMLPPGADLARRVREARFGRELWREFVLLALALLVAEMVLARSGLESPRKPEA